MTTIGQKTRAGALKAARKELGPKAIEGVDFTLRNTGACWVAVKIPPANEAAAKAQAKRKAAPKMHVSAAGLRELAKREPPKKAAALRAQADQQQAAARERLKIPAEPRTISSPNRSAGAKAGHAKRVTEGQTKTDLLVSMISRPAGATSKQLETALGWEPHSVRGLLGMLRKRGVAVESCKTPGEPTIYRIVTRKPAAPAADVGDVI